MGKYQPFHDLPAAQFSGLVDDIAKRGVLLPIIVDEDDKTIDGHQRRRAAAEAGVECPKVVVEGLSEEEKQTLAITLNLFRRHLAGVERTRALQQLANLGLSTRRMADILGVSKSTVHNDLTSLSNSGQWQRPDKVRGEDGREQPSKKPEREGPPANVDPETGEVLLPIGNTANSGSDQVDGASPAAAGPDDDDAEKVTSDPSPAPKVAPSETREERDAREAEERRLSRNVNFGKYLIGMWATLSDGGTALLDGWVPDECPMWLVDAHKPVFTPDGIREVAARMEKLAAEWESRV